MNSIIEYLELKAKSPEDQNKYVLDNGKYSKYTYTYKELSEEVDKRINEGKYNKNVDGVSKTNKEIIIDNVFTFFNSE